MSAHVGSRRVVVFARAPELGRVKTRLAAELGAAAALEIYRALGRRTIVAARAIRDCEVVVQCTPCDGHAAAAVREWLGAVTVRPQCDGDLGARMAAAVAEASADGADAIVVVGTDCPSLDTAVIERAFDALASADVVLGPATDGGYYLIAVRRPHAALFEGIPWSAAETLRATLTAAHAAGLRVTLLDPRPDIDTAADWFRWIENRAPAPAAPDDAGVDRPAGESPPARSVSP